jgi:CubicO group peptidase (beta-lactamase class C family)
VHSDPDLAAHLDGVRLAHGLPGLAWAAAPVDGPLIAGASGLRRADRPEPLELHGRLHLGSCTKPMIATVLATLLGPDLNWDTRVADVFAPGELHPAYRDVTVSQLLAHLSGLPPFGDDQDFIDAPEPSDGASLVDTFARWVLTHDPTQPPGTYAYSNAGYGVVAAMTERLTGRSWQDLTRERLFTPLGLRSAGFGWPGRHHEHEPWGHQPDGEQWTPHDPHGPYQLHGGIGPAGDAHMNILDFASFAREHLRGLHGAGRLLGPDVYARMHTPVLPGAQCGLGWGVSTYRGKRASSHSGSADTFLALLLLLPDEGHAFVVVTNAAGGAADPGTRDALRHLVAQFTSARVGP